MITNAPPLVAILRKYKAMMKCIRCAVVVLMLMPAAGACTFTPHQVPITASAPKMESSAGSDITLALQVLDERESRVVGQRGAGMIGADITAPEVLAALERELTAGFEAQGFNVVPTGTPANVDVEARLRAFKFFIEYGFFTGAENADVVVVIEAERPGEDFNQVYRASSETAALFVPGGNAIDRKLNAGLHSVLTQIVNDKDLTAFLARRDAAGT